jgi:hypothetical protein
MVAAERAGAADRFSDTLRRAVFGNPESPYLPLMRRAGVEHGDLAAMLEQDGVEPTLDSLYEAGVHVSLEEFKGRVPITRPGLELPVRAEDFDNPLISAGFGALTGGTGGERRRLSVDLTGLGREGAYYRLLLDSFGVTGATTGLWKAVPPGVSGIKAVLRGAKAGCPVARWFSPNHFSRGLDGARGRSLLSVTFAASRLVGQRMPWPEHVPADDADVVAGWLAGVIRREGRAILQCTPSSAVRVCDAADAAGLSIQGTFFRLAGEPFTEARRRRIMAAGTRAAPLYSISEVGNIGVSCPESEACDEVHLLEGKLAVLTRHRALSFGESVHALYLTCLSSETSKLMLNVESGDHAILTRRSCECALGRLGFTRRLSDIRSYEKLTTEGMTFLASDVLALVEEKLPRRFGGRSTDYQLVELAQEDRVRVALRISPHVGRLVESEVIEFVFNELRGLGRAERMMSGVWRASQTLTIVRREPEVTAAGKTPALRTLPPQAVRADPDLHEAVR